MSKPCKTGGTVGGIDTADLLRSFIHEGLAVLLGGGADCPPLVSANINEYYLNN